VFVVGVGAAVAEAFLKSLADATGGACELVAPQEGMAERVLAQFHRMRQPRLGQLAIRWPGPVAWQTDLPETVFAGDTVHVFAGFDQPVSGDVRLTGERIGEVIAAIIPATEPSIPRLAAAKRMVSASEAEGLRLALDYQLLSRWTNFLVLAERADKAEELPNLLQVPQMLAAGWGGIGDVRADVCVEACRAVPRDRYDIPGFLCRGSQDTDPPLADHADALADLDLASLRCGPEEAPRRMRSSRSVPPAPTSNDPGRSASTVHHTPNGFIGAMEAALSHVLRQPGLPTRIAELERYGLPAEVARALGDLVGQGLDEAEVVAGFLLALTESPAGVGIGRSFRRAILKAWKTLASGRDIDSALLAALARTTAEQWNWTPVSPVMATVS
jgi:Ca-activated chloride channel family protein